MEQSVRTRAAGLCLIDERIAEARGLARGTLDRFGKLIK